ncbi:nucleoporin protein Ndc1-Nup [Melampsora americana]|nr:nucleoporin protein Ndc1-Nup [Melampsora americana]
MNTKKLNVKDSYTRIYYVVLRRRACHFCVITFLTNLGLLWVSMLDGSPAVWNFLRVSFWIMGGAVWASVTIPMMMLRRSQRQKRPSPCLTRYQSIVAILGSAQHLAAAFLLSISALLLWACYVAAANALNEEPDLKLFKTMPGRGASQINERPIYLAASALFCASYYSFMLTYEQRFPSKRTDQPEGLMISQRIRRTLPMVFTRANRFSFFCSAPFLPFYLICRRYLIRAIVFSKYVQFTRFIKPHLVMMIKFNSIFTFTSNIRLVILNWLMVSCWEIVQAFWEVYLTQPLAISHFAEEPNRCLLEGLRSVDPRIQYHAIVELAQISWSDPARRVTIFQDIRTQPKIFNAIVEECLSVISATQRMVISRGEIPPSNESAGTTAMARPVNTKASDHGRPALVKDLPQLFNSQPQSNSLKKTLLSKLLTSPPENEPESLSTPTPTVEPTKNGYQMPEIFQSPRRLNRPGVDTNSRPSSLALPPTTPKRESAKRDSFSRTQKIIPKGWEMVRQIRGVGSSDRIRRLENWLFLPSARMELRRTLENHRACALAVEAVTNLMCASLTEDQYGVAQDQIPRVMGCLIECLETVTAFSLTFCEEYGAPSDHQDQNNNENNNDQTDNGLKRITDEELRESMDEFVTPLLTRLNDGSVGILNQFGPYLKEWSFSPKTEKWIQARVKKT